MPKVGSVDECTLPSSGRLAGALLGGVESLPSTSDKSRLCRFPESFEAIPIHSTLFQGLIYCTFPPFTSSRGPSYKSNQLQLGKTRVKVSFLTSTF